MLWKPDERLTGQRAREHPACSEAGLAFFQHLDDRQPDRSNRGAFLGLDEVQAARVDVHLPPFEVQDFATMSSRDGDTTYDGSGGSHLVIVCRLPDHFAKRPVFILGQSLRALLVGHFVNRADGIGFVGGVLASLGEDRAKECNRPDPGTHCSPAQNAPALAGLDVSEPLARGNVAY